jgi:hypothetical protein
VCWTGMLDGRLDMNKTYHFKRTMLGRACMSNLANHVLQYQAKATVGCQITGARGRQHLLLLPICYDQQKYIALMCKSSGKPTLNYYNITDSTVWCMHGKFKDRAHCTIICGLNCSDHPVCCTQYCVVLIRHKHLMSFA